MKPNMGTTDRFLRVVAAAVIGILYFFNVISGPVAIVLMVVAGIMLLTSFVGVCPLYLPLGISTSKKQKPAKNT